MRARPIFLIKIVFQFPVTSWLTHTHTQKKKKKEEEEEGKKRYGSRTSVSFSPAVIRVNSDEFPAPSRVYQVECNLLNNESFDDLMLI